MHRNKLQVISVILSVSLLLGLSPVSFAADPETINEEAVYTEQEESAVSVLSGSERTGSGASEPADADSNEGETAPSETTEETFPSETEEETAPPETESEPEKSEVSEETVEARYPWDTMTDEEFADYIYSGGYEVYSEDGDAIESLCSRLEIIEDEDLRDALTAIIGNWLNSLLSPDSFIMTLNLYGVTLEDLNSEEMFFRQEGSRTCTLAANAMLVRRAARLNGNPNWDAITEAAMYPAVWNEDVGMPWNYTYAGIRVGHGSFNSCNLQTVLDFLAIHPEGFVAFNANIPHAVVITDYTDGILYCGDPGYPGARVPLTSSYGAIGTQDQCIAGFTGYWFVTSPKLTLAPSRPPVQEDEEPTEPEPVFQFTVTAEPESNSVIKVSWNDNGSRAYTVYRSESEDGPWDTPVFDSAGTDIRSFRDTNCEFLKPYYYCVRSYNVVNEGRVYGEYTNVAMGIADAIEGRIADGDCGSGLKWAVYENGKMVFVGTGAIPDYASVGEAPWYSYRENIRQIILPDGVTGIGSCAFGGCDRLETITISSTVRTIGDWAFQGCVALTGINIPAGTTSIGFAAFRQCTSLQEIHVPDSVQNLGDWTFSGCTSLISAHIPQNLTAISESLFYQDAALTTVNLPDTVKTIGSNAFHGCSALAEVKLPASLETIGDYAFARCAAITVLSYSSGRVIEFGQGAFYNCAGLKNVYLPTVKLGPSAFAYCYNMRTFCLTQNGTASIVGDYAFQGCTALKMVLASGGTVNPTENGFKEVKTLILLSGSTEPDREVGDSTLRSCRAAGTCGNSSIWYVTASGNLNIAGSGAMSNYSAAEQQPWRNYRDSLRQIIVEEGVTSVGSYSMAGCTGVTSVKLPTSLQVIGNYAFCGNSGIAGISLPSNLRSVGYAAFRLCTGLQDIWVPDSVTSVGDWAFSACSSLTSVHLPQNLSSIGMAMFYQDGALTTVNLPDTVTSIAGHAFRECRKLTGVTFPAALEYVGQYAFAMCHGVGDLDFSDKSYITLDIGAFYNCMGITAVTLPSAQVGRSAFAYCYYIRNVEFTRGGASTTLADRVFNGCTRMKQITFDGSAVQFSANAFSGVTALICYRDTDGSWQDVADWSYGGNITWQDLNVPAQPALLSLQREADSVPVIIRQPVSQSVSENGNAVFTVEAEGSSLCYQWQWKSSEAAQTWTDCTSATPGSTTASLNPVVTTARNGYRYRCVITDDAGNTVVSEPAVLTVVF